MNVGDIVCALKRRENSFTSDLWKAVEQLMVGIMEERQKEAIQLQVPFQIRRDAIRLIHQELANLPKIELMQNEGSPSARKLFILWDPILRQETHLNMNRFVYLCGPILDVSRLFAEMMQHEIRCIAFCRPHKLCELVLCYTREILEETALNPSTRFVLIVLATLLNSDRRSIERDFFGRRLCGIAATNALELGIDVVEQHLVCAAYEHPLSLNYGEKYFGSGLSTAITSLKNSGYLSCDTTCDSPAKLWNYIGRSKMPSHSVSIRAIETEKYQVIDKRRNEILEEIEESKAFFQVYDGAVYICQGRTYSVQSLDLSRKVAFCIEVDLKYYTRPRDRTDIHVISGDIVPPFFVELLAAALELLKFCRCSGDTGCPNSMQNFGCHEYTEVLHKDAAIMFIKGVLDAEEQGSEGAMAE
ncbi:hypothetical protein FNV43_RR20993 [Rhamnella rubrinervis]|uniref:ATP-dependent helicase HRQ1 winged helix domain-containing protein n=1 Tax=Rhamnella rubrinervis TaxID=2594499 RepID=A0A8K0E7K3_9ROSA|nr:hypothetical protein FNV43_RR20993 [Rhamnella rubrinervis]